MKNTFSFVFVGLFLLFSQHTSLAINAMGKVFCDVNQNGGFDAADAPLPGVLVVVTNFTGTFSNANWTTTPDGRFVVALPNVTDTYAAFILPSTLSPGSEVVIPSTGIAILSVTNLSMDVGTNFLVNSSVCRTNSFQAVGQVFCDINFNGSIDPIDRPLGVLVAITNLSGTFSNVAFSTNGFFILNLPHTTDTYVEFLVPSSLPPGYIIELPASGNFTFTFGPGVRTNFFSRFLIDSPFCREIGRLNETTGRVLCDANGNGLIESDDSPLAGVMVIVTNSTATFSNAVFTSGSGTFVMALPAGPGTYTEFLNPASLPPGSTNLIPSSGVRFFIFGDAQATNVGDFLISNPGCRTNVFEATGRVACDANTNRFLDSSDPGIGGVLVVITNLSGSFSNAIQTRPDGTFTMPLPHVSDIYDQFLLPSSLPPSSTVIVPPSGVYCFVITNGQTSTFAQFLVQSPACQSIGGTNSWTKATSGAWEEPVWSLGVLPNSSQTIEITNAGFKAVGINSATVSGFPTSLNIRHLDIYGPSNSFNTLLLNFFGTAVPLRVLDGVFVGTNGRILNLFSSLIVDSGNLAITNGQFAQDSGFVGVSDAIYLGGSYDLTNGLLIADTLQVGTTPGGLFSQQGGTALLSNILVGPFQIPASSNAAYNLLGGRVVTTNILIGGANAPSSFLQTGGTNSTGDLAVEGFSAPARYDLQGGLLEAVTEEVFSGTGGLGSINQSGGRNRVSTDLRLLGSVRSGLELLLASYNMTGGSFSAKNVLLQEYSSFAQTNGTTLLSGAMRFIALAPFFRATSYLAGGLLGANSIDFAGAGENLVQTGGTLIVTNLFSFGGFAFSPPLGFATYDFLGGTLIASNIEIFGNMNIGSAGGQTHRITNPGFFRLGEGGNITTSTINEQLGRFILSGNATVDLSGGAARLAFANSSSETWSPGAILSILNWQGSTNGGGPDQIFFGASASGLTTAQLSQIKFVNPAGLPSGNYTARILSTGEVVPSGTTFAGPVNSWTKATSGNWEELFWSLGVLPNSSQTVVITNAGFKAVAITTSTVTNFPSSLTVNQLEIAAPAGSSNSLLLNFSGTATPLRVLDELTVGPNGRLLDLSSGIAVGLGGVFVTNGVVDQAGGFVTSEGPIEIGGFYNLTNGTVRAPQAFIGVPPAGTFNQIGGNALFGDLFVGLIPFQANYNLFAGLLQTTNVVVGGGNSPSRFLQQGGSNLTDHLALHGFFASANYDLVGGSIGAGREEILSGDFALGTLTQTGGRNLVTNELRLAGSIRLGQVVRPAQYFINGGQLSTASLLLEEYSTFAQTNGTTSISGTLLFDVPSAFERTTSFLAGGVLGAQNVDFVGVGGNLAQTGGTLIVSNLLSFGGFSSSPPLGFATYNFAAGTLLASNIEIVGNMNIGSAGGQTHRITNPGFFRLGEGGNITAGTINEQLGRLILSGKATIDLSGGAARLAFANSSAETWSSGAILSILNWQGSTNGGGSDQIFFNASASGLNSGQLTQIRFVNPAGFTAGTYPARILSTGEVVPVNQPILMFARSGNSLVFTWQGNAVLQAATNVVGPYIIIPNATSPTTNIISSQFQQYFRLRQ